MTKIMTQDQRKARLAVALTEFEAGRVDRKNLKSWYAYYTGFKGELGHGLITAVRTVLTTRTIAREKRYGGLGA